MLFGFFSYSQDMISSNEAEIRKLGKVKLLFDSVMYGKRVREFRFEMTDSSNIGIYGTWIHSLTHDKCYYSIFRPFNERARNARIKTLDLFEHKADENNWVRFIDHGHLVSIRLEKDQQGEFFSYMYLN